MNDQQETIGLKKQITELLESNERLRSCLEAWVHLERETQGEYDDMMPVLLRTESALSTTPTERFVRRDVAEGYTNACSTFLRDPDEETREAFYAAAKALDAELTRTAPQPKEGG